LEFDPDLEAHHPETVVLNGEPKGRKFRKKHLEILGYLMARKNEEVSYSQIAKEVWETTVGGPYGTIYKTTQQVAKLIGNDWIKHKPNVSIEFCALIPAEHPAPEYILSKESENVLIEVDGRGVASLWVPPFRRPLPPPRTNNVLTLLLAKTAITDLVGRDDLWRECLAWCDDSSLGPVSVFCIQGRGGCGKTRFALELVHYLRSLDGWDARFVQFQRSEAFDLWEKTAGPNHILLVCDYASDHAVAIADSLRLLKGRPPGDATRRIRILLLARSARFRSGWLLPFESTSTLEHGQSPRDYFRPNNPIAELTPLSIEDRIRVFKQTYFAAAKHFELGEQTLDEANFQNEHIVDVLADPLSLMLVALAGLQNGISNALLLTKSELARETARLFVEQRLRAAFPENAALALHMTTYATISSELTLNAALEIMMKESQALHLGSVADPVAFLKRLAAWLPSKDGDRLGAVEPDILGEAFAFDQLCTWCEAAKEVLIRSAQDHPLQTTRFIVRLVQDFSLVNEGSREEPLQWLGEIIERGCVTDYALLREICDTLNPSFVKGIPYVLTVLRKINSKIMNISMATHFDPPTGLHADLPSLAIDMALAEYLTGDDADASVRVDDAISGFEALAGLITSTGYVRFAVSLERLARFEDEHGLSERALAHAREVVGLYRRLSNSGCGYWAPYFGNALILLSAIEKELNQLNSAVAHATEALTLFQALSHDDSTEYYWECANLSRRLGNLHYKLGDTEAAHLSAQEEVNSLKELARRDRITILPVLSEALWFLSYLQIETRRLKKAFANAEEAVACHRELVKHDRSRFLPHLESSLIALLAFLKPTRKYSRAPEIAQELVIISRQMAEENRISLCPECSTGSEYLEVAKEIAESR
jgi:tetratricopeptide (TPR) repeat protein